MVRPALFFTALLLVLLAIAEHRHFKPIATGADELHTCASLYRIPAAERSQADSYRLPVCEAEDRLALSEVKRKK
jgi:hypothetical protein